MTYLELRELIMDESHRPDLTARIESFVRRAEAMIARELRATEMLTQVSLLDADRISAGSAVYDLPDDFLEDRTVVCDGRIIRKVSRAALLRASETGDVLMYAMRTNTTDQLMEFRAIPGDEAELELEYFARPAALTADGDTNRLLDGHDSAYLHPSLFALYMWTQDTELAQASLDTWKHTRDTLNEQAGRYLGGTEIAPNLNLGHFRTGGGY